MLIDYFRDISTGRLLRMRFVVLWVILVAAFVCFGLAVGASIGVAEHMVGGDLAEAQKLLREKLAIPAIIGVALFFLLFAFAKLNIIAKRARDVGLPGWITAIVIAMLSGTTSQMAGAGTAGGVGAVLLVVLACLPSNTVGGRKNA